MVARRVLPALLALSLLTGCAAAGNAGDDGRAKTDSAASDVANAELSPAVQRQLDYALQYWSDYNDAYEVLGEDDCVNFTSQTLVERGWQQDDDWYYDEDSVYDSSPAWRSSTAFLEYLSGRPDLATALDDGQRDQAVPGDIVQFDWDGSGDRDHTGIVTRVERTETGTRIYFAGHTEDSDYRDVDQAITVDHPGGVAYYWHLADA